MWFLMPLCRRVEIDQHPSVFDFDLVGRNTIILEPGFALAVAAMKFSVMPGADDVLTIEPALAQWSACVVARV
jgi:hypothetical protein